MDRKKTGYKTVIGILLFLVQALATANAATWSVEKPAGESSACFIKSAPQKMNDGYRTISVHAEIRDQVLSVVTPSNIDTGFSDIRIQVDRKPPIQLARLDGKQTARFSVSPQTINDMRRGKSLKAYIRFWPTWPVTKAHAVSFSLKGFTAISKAVSDCN